MNLRQELEKRISAALATAGAVDAAAMVAPTDPKFGDYKASGVMAAAKKLKLNPRELAEKVVAILRSEKVDDGKVDGKGDDGKGDGKGDCTHFRRLKMGTVPFSVAPFSDLAEKIDIAGPGFINITLKDSWISAQLGAQAGDERIGVPDALACGSRLNVVVDYSAPNLAKEMHVGHLRSTIIGDALARTLEFQGHNVIRQNHVGDWGTQFGMLATYFTKWLDEEGERRQKDEKPILVKDVPLPDLEEFYRLAKAQFDSAQGFQEAARNMVVRLQQGDGEAMIWWSLFRDKSLEHAKQVYRRLSVSLTDDDVRGESAYNDDLPAVIAGLAKSGLLAESQGAMCVFLDQFVAKDGTPLPLIVQKSDEGYLYATTDLAAVRYRVGTLHADRVLYVVDARQSLHFQMVFAAARAAGFAPESISLEHVAFGTMMGADGKPFKTRTGGTVKLMDLLDEAVKRAYDLVTRKNADEVAKGRSQPISEEQKKSIAEAVGIGAVKYSDLAQNRNSDYVFSWEKMLAMDGNTAPYLQYAYARIKSIFRKERDSGSGIRDSGFGIRDSGHVVISLGEPAERALAIRLLQFPETVAAVGSDCLPSVLCAYLYDLAGAFTTFYENCPVLKSDEPIRASRLALCDLTAKTIRKGLELLGISVIEQM